MQLFNKYSKLIYIISLVLFLILFPLLNLSAQSVFDEVNSRNPNCLSSGDCNLNDFLLIAIGITKIILGLSGSLALLAFVVGGVMFLASGGNKAWIDRGKSTIIGAVIGLIIVFASFTIIGFIFKAMGITSYWFSSGWF